MPPPPPTPAAATPRPGPPPDGRLPPAEFPPEGDPDVAGELGAAGPFEDGGGPNARDGNVSESSETGNDAVGPSEVPEAPWGPKLWTVGWPARPV